MRVGGRCLEWHQIQVDNYRDERREEVEREVMMKNTFSCELNCQVDVEKIRGLRAFVCESLKAYLLFAGSFIHSRSLCIHLKQRQTPGNSLQFNMQLTG